tara:strand:- start:64 stop:180 length:117 start_codon:yes stop_codon:yes gene_type:complete
MPGAFYSCPAFLFSNTDQKKKKVATLMIATSYFVACAL